MRYPVPLWFCTLLLAGGCALYKAPPADTYGCLRLAEEDSSFAEALAHYAEALVKTSEYGPYSEETLDAYREAMVRDPDRRLLRASVVRILNVNAKPDESVEILREYADSNKKDASAQLDAAFAASAAKDYDSATKYYLRAVKINPRTQRYITIYSRLLFSLNRDKNALDLLVKSSKYVNDTSEITRNITNSAIFFMNKREYSRAEECTLALLKIHKDKPAVSETYKLLADIYYFLGLPGKSISSYKKSLKNNPSNYKAETNMALTLSEESPGKATRILIDAISKTPSQPRFYTALSKIYNTHSNAVDALSVMKTLFDSAESLISRPFPSESYIHYALLLQDNNREPDALVILKQGVTYYRDNARLLNLLAYSLAELDTELEYAETCATLALKEEPLNPAIIDTLGWIYYRQKRYPEALQELKKAEQSLPDDPEILLHIADILKAMNRNQDAGTYRQKALDADPESKDLRKKNEKSGDSIKQ